MKIAFLGTNGWYSTRTGNTPCTLIDSASYYIVFDAGDGIYKLHKYITDAKPIFLFLSHFHLEHINGIHILAKFQFNQALRIYGQVGTRQVVNDLARHPFTVPLKDLPFRVEICELTEGTHKIPFPVTCKPLLHADPCFGYRITLDNRTVAYCTDTGACNNTVELANNADVLIHECALKSGQRNEKWPHTSPQEAAEIAKASNVKQLVLTHFDAAIYESIGERKQAETEARWIFKNTTAAIDGMELTI